MLWSTTVSFAAPLPLTLFVLLLVLFAIGIAIARPSALAPTARLALVAGLALAALAAGQPIWHTSSQGAVAVLVDLSPSTRGAAYRDRAALEQRIHQLLGNTPYSITAFADGGQALPSGATLHDLPASQTRLAPPTADAILLFSDGRFAPPPALPPTFAVIDPSLDSATDAAIVKLEMRDGNVVGTVSNNSPPRELHWSGATPDDATPITSAVVRAATPLADGGVITAALSPGDRWPENDSLSIYPAPAEQRQRWWIGDRAAGPGWRSMSPTDVPSDPGAYVNAAVIVLDNVAADAITSLQRDRLAQYVRDLGGGLLILGGAHAFAAGGYDGTPLDAISPLASSPSNPTTHWILLADASGSMASETPTGGTRWQAETAALTALLPRLPSNDLASVGAFAESLTWWSTGRTAHDTAMMTLPPPATAPDGPTNLAAALQQVVRSSGDLATELLVLTDAETDLPNPDAIATELIAKRIRLHALVLGSGSALPALTSIATRTGGAVIEQADPGRWTPAAQQLLRSAAHARLAAEPIDVTFEGSLAELGGRTINSWNRTWLKPRATRMAHASDAPLAARWAIGSGQVAAMAWRTDFADAERVAHIVAAVPRDPRFTLSWQMARSLHVAVDAVDRGTPVNGEQLTLTLSDPAGAGASSATPIPQVAPGRYELSVPTTGTPRIATVYGGDKVIERFAVASRYSAEFDAIGNDQANLQELASRSGGAVISPDMASPIALPRSSRDVSLAPWLAAAGAALCAAALVRRRTTVTA